MNIMISNISLDFKNEDLKNLFTPFGDVQSADIAIDGFTEQPRGFGYVEMQEEEQALAAIQALDQSEVNGCVIGVRAVAESEFRKGSYKVSTGSVNLMRQRRR